MLFLIMHTGIDYCFCLDTAAWNVKNQHNSVKMFFLVSEKRKKLHMRMASKVTFRLSWVTTPQRTTGKEII